VVDALEADVRVLDIGGRRAFRYRSVYFDTDDAVSYYTAARRRPGRFKVRARTYLDHDRSLLEVKLRNRRGQTVKHRMELGGGRRVDGAMALDGDALAFLASFPAVAPHAQFLSAALTTSYRRTTLLLDGGGGGRVTIDTELCCHRGSGRAALRADLVLVETKTAGRPGPFDRALWACGHRPVAISKYATGRAVLEPGLPANHWHRALRHFRTVAVPPSPMPS
jgi:hypothetical protein